MHLSLSGLIYVIFFGAAAVACYVTVVRARLIPDDDTQRGLVALLLFSGTWAAASVGRLVVHAPALQITFYMIGLTVGLATVGAWLYFSSAYAGYDYHHQTTIRQVALTAFLVITGIKLTNPLHQLYFTTGAPTGPLQRVAIELSVFHWSVTGLSYALTAIGFYLLFELFQESRLQTRALGGLVALTAVPAIVDIVAFSGLAPDFLLQLNYEPIGVAAFAVGVLFIVDEQFVAVPRFWRKELVEYLDQPIILLDTDDSIRDFNSVAAEMFPGLAQQVGVPLEQLETTLPATDEFSDNIVSYDQTGPTRFFTVQRRDLSSGPSIRGSLLIYQDVTEVEQHRRELQRQNDQLDGFATALNHELRNAITVFQGALDVSAEAIAEKDSDSKRAVGRAVNAIGRMERVIGDLSTLAHYGQTPETIEDCHLGAIAEAAWNRHEFSDMNYRVATDAIVEANPSRLERILSDIFRFSDANGASQVTVTVEDDAIVITGCGKLRSETVVEKAFEYGPPVAAPETEMALPNVQLIARVQGWTATIDTSATDEVRIRLDDVTVA